LLKRVVKPNLRAWSTSVLNSIIWRLIDYEFWILCSTLVKAYCDSEGTTKHGLSPILLRRSQFYLMFSGCIVIHLDLWLYNVLSTSAFVMISLQWIPKQYIFYLNVLNLYMLLPILKCRGRFLLSVFFWKRDIPT
jgi:hypothetical protein